jgi:DNA replication protein DnaC
MGREACRLGFKVKFFTVAGLANRYAEAREQREVLKLERQIEKYDAIVLDELGYVALGQDCPEHLFNFVSGCYERTSLIVTTNLPFSEWTKVFRDERLTGALLDRFTHRIHILSLEGESHRFLESQRRLQKEPESCGGSAVVAVTRAKTPRDEGEATDGSPEDRMGE